MAVQIRLGPLLKIFIRFYIFNVYYKSIIKKEKEKKKSFTRTFNLKKCPHKKGICVKIRIVKPKKPNSAKRKIAKVYLNSGRFIIAYISGQGHSLQKSSVVLIRGGRVRDLPGMQYKLIRGKYDFLTKENFNRRNKLSKHGMSKKKLEKENN